MQSKVMGGKKRKVTSEDFYNQEAKNYIRQYRHGYDKYPGNLIRLRIIVGKLKKNKVESILDAGCGTCGPMIRLLKEGFSVEGFDSSKEMLSQGREELRKEGYPSGLIYSADIEDAGTITGKKFDAVLALGVFPHVKDEKRALANIKKLLNPEGSAFISFRNDLFAVYTLNNYSVDFFLNRVIHPGALPPAVRRELSGFYSERLRTEGSAGKREGMIRFDQIPAKFHNPLSIKEELFKPCGFSLQGLYFYHYHALPPVFENKYPGLFRKLSLKMERPGDWRGYLAASAFVAEVKKES